MARFTTSGGISVNVERDWLDVTCGIDTLDSEWVGTDVNGHEHRAAGGYPTLNHIIDEQHWCEGDEGWSHHDPHMHVDRSHYECKTCGVDVEPGIIPAYTPKFIPGTVAYTVSGTRTDGVQIEAWVTEDQAQAIPGMDGEAMQRFVDSLPDEQITSRKFSR